MKGMSYESDSQNQRIMYGLVNHFFDNANYKNYVKDRLPSLKTTLDMYSSNITEIIYALEREDGMAAHIMAQ